VCVISEVLALHIPKIGRGSKTLQKAFVTLWILLLGRKGIENVTKGFCNALDPTLR